MSGEQLFDAVMNDQKEHDAVLFAVRHLRHALDRVAVRLARANALWHDDPQADDHAAFHAPALVQYPRAERDRAARDLVDHWLSELALQDEREGTQ